MACVSNKLTVPLAGASPLSVLSSASASFFSFSSYKIRVFDQRGYPSKSVSTRNNYECFSHKFGYKSNHDQVPFNVRKKVVMLSVFTPCRAAWTRSSFPPTAAPLHQLHRLCRFVCLTGHFQRPTSNTFQLSHTVTGSPPWKLTITIFFSLCSVVGKWHIKVTVIKITCPPQFPSQLTRS